MALISKKKNPRCHYANHESFPLGLMLFINILFYISAEVEAARVLSSQNNTTDGNVIARHVNPP